MTTVNEKSYTLVSVVAANRPVEGNREKVCVWEALHKRSHQILGVLSIASREHG
jgi:hypothetical protein